MSALWSIAIFCICMLASSALTGVARAYALGSGLLDVPNERSSHSRVIPRGGGIAVVAVVLAAAAVLTALGAITATQSIAWLGGGSLIAVVGYVDDHRGLSVVARLCAQLAAAGLALYATHGLPPIPWRGADIELGLAGWILGSVIVTWAINLFNFMDGIDGIAAQQGMFMAGSACLLQWGMGPNSLGVMLCVICAAAAGFLVWNWPPARIFLGDVGSGFLGFALALAALLSWRAGPMSLWTWLILDGLFVVDATVTLITRAARGARIFAPHREHVYQRLAIRFGSHAQVTVGYFALNVLWLLPWAMATVRRPTSGGLISLVALSPIAIAAIVLGAGREAGPAKRA
jgi:Fuc2NAc and GlcNAc transferase